jgi:hypothetical protein
MRSDLKCSRQIGNRRPASHPTRTSLIELLWEVAFPDLNLKLPILIVKVQINREHFVDCAVPSTKELLFFFFGEHWRTF